MVRMRCTRTGSGGLLLDAPPLWHAGLERLRRLVEQLAGAGLQPGPLRGRADRCFVNPLAFVARLSEEHPDDETWPGLLIVRTEGRIFFANAQRVGGKMWPLVEQMKPSVSVLDCSAVIDIEYTALKMLAEAEEGLRRDGIMLWLAALNPDVLAVVKRSRIGETLGRERMFFNLQRAVEKYEQAR